MQPPAIARRCVANAAFWSLLVYSAFRFGHQPPAGLPSAPARYFAMDVGWRILRGDRFPMAAGHE